MLCICLKDIVLEDVCFLTIRPYVQN